MVPYKPFALVAMLMVVVLASGQAAAQEREVCRRLESQLAEIDHQRREADSQLQRYDRALAERTEALHAAVAERNQVGCRERSFFFSPSRQELPGCAAIEGEIRRLEAEINRLHSERARTMPRRDNARDHERGHIAAALARNGCGPHYARQAAPPATSGGFGNWFERFFNERAHQPPGYEHDYGYRYGGATYRTLCVRSCDGYYWPISFSTVQGRFGGDAETCRSSCQGAEVELYVHRNPGEGIDEAVSLYGTRYGDLPNAYRYRQEYDASCACRPPSRLAARLESARRGSGTMTRVSEPPRREAGRDAAAPQVVTGVPLPRPHPQRPAAAQGTDPQTRVQAEDEHTYVTRDGRRIRIVGPEFTYFRPSGGEPPRGL